MINIYDFDGTIFDGDSTLRFVLFALKRRPALLVRLPRVGLAFLAHALGLRSKTWAKQEMYRQLLPYIDAGALLGPFWEENLKRVKRWYHAQKREGDIVISASPEFLLAPACEALGVRQLVASKVDRHTGDYDGENCHGEEKVRRYLMECPREPFCFYSDSKSDAPMARLAQAAYRVRGDRIEDWPRV